MDEFEARERRQIDELVTQLAGTDLIEEYRVYHHKRWKTQSGGGYTDIPVLPQFWGKKLTNLLLAYLPALRPSAVRISEGVVTCDACLWRVTIRTETIADRSAVIREITQEVPVGFHCGSVIDQIFRHQHEGASRPATSPTVIGNLDALSRLDFS
jgi:hypothetical protein